MGGPTTLELLETYCTPDEIARLRELERAISDSIPREMQLERIQAVSDLSSQVMSLLRDRGCKVV